MLLQIAVLSSCIATTNIDQFRDEVAKACGADGAIKSISLMAEDTTLTLTMTYTFDCTNENFVCHRPAGSPVAFQARNDARGSYEHFQSWKPLEKFVLKLRDVNDREICTFTYFKKGKLPIEVCAPVIDTP